MRNLWIFAIGLLLTSCTTSSKNAVDIPTLKSEVMAIHDEVMPKMGELRKTSKELRSVAEEDSSKVQWVETADLISNADESMMVWMRGFEPNYEGSNQEIIRYLQDQKVKIERVREDINGSLAKGKSLLAQ